MKTFIQIREELDKLNLKNLNEAEDSKVTSSIEKKDPDAMHMATHGTQHVYIGGQSDRENHSYHVHDTSTGKTHHVSLDHGGKAMSHGAVKSAAGSKVSSAAVKAIHSDHKDELSESTIQESVRALPKGYVNHETIKDNIKNYGDGVKLGHGAHEIEHPEEPGGSGRATYKTPSHPHAYAHHDKKTGKVTAVEIKHKKTSAAAVAKAMGHKEVGPQHHAIADTHNDENLV